jgi:drug/metabolite transporter (DMT)-like permease
VIDLALAAVLAGLFAVIVRLGQKRGADLTTIGFANYVSASLTFAPFLRLHPPPAVTSHTLLLGGIGGVIYATAYFLFLPVLANHGVAIGSAVARLSVIMPMGLSLALWGEVPTPIRAIGAAIAVAALPLLATGRLEGSPARPRREDVLTLAGLFVFNGGCFSVGKWYHVTGTLAERPAYFMVLFGVAALYTGIVWGVRSRQLRAEDVLIGVALGVTNAFSNLTLLRALDAFSGVVTFPVTSAGALVFAVLFAAVWWRELPSRWGTLGLVLAVAAVVLINL